MNDISTEEKIELLENWKQTLFLDIEQFTEEVNKQLDKKNRSIAAFNVRLKNMTEAISKSQSRVDKTRIQIAEVEREIGKAKQE